MTEPAPSASPWRLSLLGSWDLVDGTISVHVGDSAQKLIALLALRGQRDRAFVAGTLWPDCTEPQAQANLRATLSRLRRRDRLDVVDASGGTLRLQPFLSVDVHDLVHLVSVVLSESEYSWWQAVRLLTGDQLLPGWYDDWILNHREQLRQLCLHALEAIADQQHGKGNYSAAVQAGLASVAIEPLRESAHRQIIRAHLAAGNRAEAMRQFGLLRKLLLEEVGAEPSAAAIELLDDVALARGSVG
jgi:DNA-binding SARP family transcriptional activator